MINLKTLISQIPFNADIKYNLFKSGDHLRLHIDYKDRAFTIEKSFQDNYWGKQEAKKFLNRVDSEDKIRKYLGLEQ